MERKKQTGSERKRVVKAADLYCGGGGFSDALRTACEELGLELDLIAINHWDKAIATHSANLPNARHICMTLEMVDPKVEVAGGKLDILLAAPECTHHSRARGGKPVNDQSRINAWQVVKWLTDLDVTVLVLENVPEFKAWGPLIKRLVKRRITFKLPLTPFDAWVLKMRRNGGTKIQWRRIYAKLRKISKQDAALREIKIEVQITCLLPDPRRKGLYFWAFVNAIKALEYNVEWRILNSADYGGFTSRSRFFLIAKKGNRKIRFPMPTHTKDGRTTFLGKTEKYKAAKDIIDWSDLGESIFGRDKPLAPNTMRRVFAGLEKFSGLSFILPNEGVFRGNQPRPISDLIPTITQRGGGMFVNPVIVPFLGERDGKSPRAHSVDVPVPSPTSHGAGAIVTPFLVSLSGTSDDAIKGSQSDIDGPVPTIRAQGTHHGVATPVILNVRGGDDGYTRGSSVDELIPAITTHPALELATPVAKPFYIGIGGPEGSGKPKDTDKPFLTVLTEIHSAVARPVLQSFLFGQQSGAMPRSANEPIPSPATDGAIRVVNPFVMPVHHSDDTRASSVEDLMPTITGFDGLAFANGYIIPYHGGDEDSPRGHSVNGPLPVQDTSNRYGLAQSFLFSMEHSQNSDASRVKSLDEPMPGMTTADAWMMVNAYLVKYYGMGANVASVDEPLPSQPTKDKFGLVSPILVKTPEGKLWLFDILLRMLKPKELATAMGFRKNYIFVGTREEIVKQIGNAVEHRVGKALCLEGLRHLAPGTQM